MSGFKFKDADVKRMRLEELKPAEYNPRRISDSALEKLGESMERFGFMVPVVWNKRTGNIVGGHQRYKKLMADGQEETDVVVVDLDDNEEMALNIALNSRELRGDFTKEVVQQLKECEAQMGDAFGDVGLVDLLNFVKRLKFDEVAPAMEDGGSGAGSEDGLSSSEIPTGPDALITCPRCRSSWRMKDNKVVFNAARKGSAGAKEGTCQG